MVVVIDQIGIENVGGGECTCYCRNSYGDPVWQGIFGSKASCDEHCGEHSLCIVEKDL